MYTAIGAVSSTDYVKRGSVCKPANSATLAIFKTMQTQLNRVAQAVGVSKIAVDGDIGSGTLTLLSRIASKMSMTSALEVTLANEATNDCSTVASRAETISFFAKSVADAKGVSANAGTSGGSSGGGGGGGGSTPIVTIPPGSATVPGASSGIMASLSSLGGLEKAALAVGAVAVGVALFGKKRGRR